MASLAIGFPLAASIGTCICTVVVHGLALNVVVHFVRYEHRLDRAGVSFWGGVGIVALATMILLAAHLIEIAIWAGVFVGVGEFQDIGIALYHSAVNYTTLGYGDIVMSRRWKLMAPLEAADGMLMFGITTAAIFTVIQRLVQVRFPDLHR